MSEDLLIDPKEIDRLKQEREVHLKLISKMADRMEDEWIGDDLVVEARELIENKHSEPHWLLDWLDGRLRFEGLTLDQRDYLLKRYKKIETAI